MAVLPACSGDDEQGAGPGTTAAPLEEVAVPATAPVATLPIPEGFVIPDTRGVALPRVESEEQPGPDPAANLLPVRGGRATLTVRVDGPVDRDGGLVVRFERLEGGLRGWEDVPAGRDGVAVLDEALGGRYRVRAWRRPDLASLESQTLFLGFDDTRDVRVRVERHDDLLLQGALTVGAWRVGDVVPLLVLAVREEVDASGIVRGRPEAVEVELRQIVGAAVEDPRVVLSDGGSGYATFAVRCDLPGEHRLVAVGGGAEATVALPACLPRLEPTTTTTTEPDEPPASSTTSSSAPRRTTTTTTRVRQAP